MILDLVDYTGGSGWPAKVGLSESFLVPIFALFCLDNRPWAELQLKAKCTNPFPSKLAGQSTKGQQNNKQVRTVAGKLYSRNERVHF